MSENVKQKWGAMTGLFIGGGSAFGLSAFGYALYNVASGPLSFEWLLLSVVTIVAVSRIDPRFTKTPSVVHTSDLFIFLSMLLYGPFPSVLLAGINAAVCSFNNRERKTITLFNSGVTSLAVFISGTISALTLNSLGEMITESGAAATAWEFGRSGLALGLMVALYYAVKALFASGLARLEAETEFGSAFSDNFLWQEAARPTIVGYAGVALMSVLLQVAAVLSFNGVIIGTMLLVITYLSYKGSVDKTDASNKYMEQMADLHLRTIEALAIAVDAKDEVTHDHVFRVQVYATGLARHFGLSAPEVEALKAGAILHDIGKLAVPDYILNKPGKLTAAEFDEMKMHTVVGAEILERVRFPYPVVPVVRHHHERWDGRGYPDGLAGEQIPMTARIISVVDCFDAVREDRQYRKAMTRDEAIGLIKSSSGTMYDPRIVEAFIENLPKFEAEIERHKQKVQPFEKRERSAFFKTRAEGLDQEVFDRVRDAHREIDSLSKVAQAVGTSLNLRDALTIFSSRLQDIVSYTTCVLYLVRQDSTEVEAVHASGRNSELFTRGSIPLGAGIAGWVVANGHPMHNSDPRLDFDAMKAVVPERYKTATVVPLLKEGKAIGALALYSAEVQAYDAGHLRLIEAVAKLASDAIAGAINQDGKGAEDLTDKVTELPNARALRYRFEIEADRARRHGESFAVVMMDLDGFRQMNEKLGQEGGDHLLWKVGKELSSLVRSSDFVGRFSADRFVAMLQVSPEEVEELVERIRRTLEQQDFGFVNSNIFIQMSVGWAFYGKHGETLDELLVAALHPMFQDKARRKSAHPRSESEYVRAYDLSQYKVM